MPAQRKSQPQARSESINKEFEKRELHDFKAWLYTFLTDKLVARGLSRNHAGLHKAVELEEYDIWISLLYERKVRYTDTPSWVQDKLYTHIVTNEILDEFVEEELPQAAADIRRTRELEAARRVRAVTRPGRQRGSRRRGA
ncbi:hypothetical protein C1H76_3871 [Elsinoe australis]|uniref:Uncharacterized protein n=1 Tax=Elsinoe australis TaxID=40998 RepID=A0A4U7AZ21_9PEZI|nr:hypothetical protein C1H76_3871 [Elsinoe australis]